MASRSMKLGSLAAYGIVVAALAGCGAILGIDDVTGGDAGTSAGSSGSGSTRDGGSGSTSRQSGGSSASSSGSGSGGSDGPCDLAEFAIGLIHNDTNETASPSSNLGQACTDKQDQTQFTSLF